MAELIPAGYYNGKPTGGKLTTTTNGTPQFAVNFLLDNGDNRTVFMFTTDAAWPFTEEKLKAIGWDGNPDEMHFTAEAVELQCKHETYKEKTREKWDVAGGKKEWEPAPADVKRSVMARWKASAGKTTPAPVAAGSNARLKEAATTPMGDDDIPF